MERHLKGESMFFGAAICLQHVFNYCSIDTRFCLIANIAMWLNRKRYAADVHIVVTMPSSLSIEKPYNMAQVLPHIGTNWDCGLNSKHLKATFPTFLCCWWCWCYTSYINVCLCITVLFADTQTTKPPILWDHVAGQLGSSRPIDADHHRWSWLLSREDCGRTSRRWLDFVPHAEAVCYNHCGCTLVANFATWCDSQKPANLKSLVCDQTPKFFLFFFLKPAISMI